ncbi:MAG: vitamin K epoxide reductase family protein [Anaerolineales bacterium]|nr:vitamin K epoxide reductase family protein [Anaerolineales bacterium]
MATRTLVKTIDLSDQRLRMASVLLALVGLADSAYLTYIKLANATASCGNIGDCDAVNSSPYAEFAGIPIALFGAGAYLAILALLLMEPRLKLAADYSRLAVLGISLAGVIYSAYLTYIEVAVLYAICPYCVLSALVITAIFGLALIRYWRGQPEVD